jgi:hypothetical protein
LRGLAANASYMADLDDEFAEVSDAYVAVTEIATLRTELFGPANSPVGVAGSGGFLLWHAHAHQLCS